MKENRSSWKAPFFTIWTGQQLSLVGSRAAQFALLGSLVSISSPLGLAIAGPVSDRFGIQIWFVVAGILCIAVGIAAFFIPAIIHIEENHQAKGPVKTASPSEVAAD